MKTSIDLPDDLYRRVKARSALEGRAVREVATELLTQWVESAPTSARTPEATKSPNKPSKTWQYEWAALGARIESAMTQPASRATRGRKSSKGERASTLTLVEQLKRDRR